VGAVSTYLSVWFFSWLMVAYNSLIELRHRVRQAWANVDVQLKRRTDLIPNLVQMVEGLRHHEQDVQVELAHLRTQLVATAPGQPGPDPSSCAPALRILAERYPALTADHAFATLASTLEDCEERVALANTYYNDIATFLNTRLQTGFGILFTSMGGFQVQPLLQSGSFPRRPEPAVPTGSAQ
jgi:LemA protein